MLRYLDFSHITLAHPQFFLMLLLIPLLEIWRRRSKKYDSSLLISTSDFAKDIKPSAKLKAMRLIPFLRYLSLFFMIIALARPQNTSVSESIDSEGVDMVLSMDISGSMLAEDLKPNRLEAAKKVAKEFVSNRYTDRIGLVIFSGESFTQCPITTDQSVLQMQLSNVKSGLLEDGTAIGMGLATAVERLRNSKSKSKVIILLTDGVNNAGLIDPMTALEIAKAFKIRVYTIGVGTKGMANYPVPDQYGNTTMQQMEVQIDEDLMRQISSQTGGRYFRATDNASLEKIYKEIDMLEKTKIEISSHKKYAELFYFYALLGLCVFVLEWILKITVFKSVT